MRKFWVCDLTGEPVVCDEVRATWDEGWICTEEFWQKLLAAIPKGPPSAVGSATRPKTKSTFVACATHGESKKSWTDIATLKGYTFWEALMWLEKLYQGRPRLEVDTVVTHHRGATIGSVERRSQTGA